MPKYGTVRFSDLSGPTNPTGILSPAFLFLKQALDRGAPPDEVLAALEEWLGNKTQRGIKTTELQKLLQLEPQQALTGLIQLIGGGLSERSLPPTFVDTLRRALTRIAGKHVASREAEMDVERQQLGHIKSKFGVESATRIVASLLEDY